MIYILFPNTPTFMLPDDGDVSFGVATNISLDGCFYDHICSVDGNVVGVRYYVDMGVTFSRHPVFNQFLQDKRILFNQDKLLADIFFEKSHLEIFKNGSLHIDCVQEFGGESIVTNDDLFGICLRIKNGTVPSKSSNLDS